MLSIAVAHQMAANKGQTYTNNKTKPQIYQKNENPLKTMVLDPTEAMRLWLWPWPWPLGLGPGPGPGPGRLALALALALGHTGPVDLL